MSWRSEWQALSERIASLMKAAHYMTVSLSGNSFDMNLVANNFLIPEAEDIVQALNTFAARCGKRLPGAARDALDDFISKAGSITPSSVGRSTPVIDLRISAALEVFRSRMEYLLRDHQAAIRALSERAFEHLQRSIVADADVRSKWANAFGAGETTCEGLGAAHLLSHGIWAFKVRGAGDAPGAAEATDLVYHEPLDNIDQIERVAEGLVLTEWKLVRSRSELEEQRSRAIRQAELYRSGVLGGVELTKLRYVVLVSDDVIYPGSDATLGDVTYRTIMIRVAPSSASKAARRV